MPIFVPPQPQIMGSSGGAARVVKNNPGILSANAGLG